MQTKVSVSCRSYQFKELFLHDNKNDKNRSNQNMKHPNDHTQSLPFPLKVDAYEELMNSAGVSSHFTTRTKT